MTYAITKRHLKALINQGHWAEIGKLFNFKPVYMGSATGKPTIDWRCVPRSVSDILINKDLNERFLIEVLDEPARIVVQPELEPEPVIKLEPVPEPTPIRVRKKISVGRKGRKTMSSKVPDRTRGQCEFIGDHIIGMAAAELVFEHVKGGQSSQYVAYHRLVSNMNMGGDDTETEIGEIYYLRGYDEALSFAKEVVTRTPIWITYIKEDHANP